MEDNEQATETDIKRRPRDGLKQNQEGTIACPLCNLHVPEEQEEVKQSMDFDENEHGCSPDWMNKWGLHLAVHWNQITTNQMGLKIDPRVEKLKQDALFRHKVLYTLCIYLGFAVIGWIKGQIGPSFNDLLYISGVGLETGSWIVTTFFIGYTVGSLLGAVLYEKMNRQFLFFTCQFVLVAMLLAIPWCYTFPLMVVAHFAHFIKGMAEGVIDPVSNTEILRLWGEKANTYIIGLNISLSIGSIISPLLTEPFLVELKDNSPSQLYKAYTITATFSFCVAVSFLILYSTTPEQESSPNLDSTEGQADKAENELPKKYVMFALPVMGAMLFFFNAIDEAYVSYLPTFCIEHLKWTKSQAAYITSVMFILVFVSRIISMFMIKCLGTIQVVGLQCLLMLFSFIGLLISASIKFEPGIWISGPMVGYSKSVIFGLIFAWTNEYFVQVTGKLSSAFFVVAMIGSSINPVVLGQLMKNFTNMWFCYLFAIQSLALLGLFIVGAVLSWYTRKRFGTRFRKNELVTNDV